MKQFLASLTDEQLNSTHYELLARQIERFAFNGGAVTIPSEEVPNVIIGLRLAAAFLARRETVVREMTH